jgi:hypothetical protein
LGACQIALLLGDFGNRRALRRNAAHGACHQGALTIKRGEVVTGSRLLRAGIDGLDRSRPTSQFFILLTTEALGDVGQVSRDLPSSMRRSSDPSRPKKAG